MMEKTRFYRKENQNGWAAGIIAGLVCALMVLFLAPKAETKPAVSTPPGSFSELVKQASPSVVNISVEKVVRGRGGTPSPIWF